ncbi:unnamed protein product, partial [Owenia fusiformis]
ENLKYTEERKGMPPIRQAKYVPWEPYKGAVKHSPGLQNKPPFDSHSPDVSKVKLVPYQISPQGTEPISRLKKDNDIDMVIKNIKKHSPSVTNINKFEQNQPKLESQYNTSRPFQTEHNVKKVTGNHFQTLKQLDGNSLNKQNSSQGSSQWDKMSTSSGGKDGKLSPRCLSPKPVNKVGPLKNQAKIPTPPPSRAATYIDIDGSFESHGDAILNNSLEVKKLKEENGQLKEYKKRLLEEKEGMKEELDKQIEVNRDLKKLLVASVGDELEYKVERMAQDNAQLSKDMIDVTERREEDYEHLDKMTIAADVWRSKYMASRVMIDELANWKAHLQRKYKESQDALQQILDERHDLRTNLIKTYGCLRQLKDGFELMSNTYSQTFSPSGNVIELASINSQLVATIQMRLLGKVSSSVALNMDMGEDLTYAEWLAKQLLEGQSNTNAASRGGTQEQQSVDSLRRQHYERYHPNVRYENVTFNCCAQCTGDVMVV